MNRVRRVVIGLVILGMCLSGVAPAGWGAVAPAAAQTGTETGEVRVSAIVNLNLRAAPTTASQRYNIIPYGTVVPATAISPNFRWVRVAYAGQGGWVYRGYLQVEQGSLARLPISSEAVPPALISGVVEPGAVVVSPRTDVNIRMEPDPEADVITYLPRGAQVSAISVTSGGLWILVQYRGYRGWVNGRYFQVVNGSMTDFSQPTGLTFSADKDSVTPGACATLSWNVQNAAQVYYQGESVAASGSRQECPLTTTTYTLRSVTYGNQSVERYVTITVVGTPPIGTIPGGTVGGTSGGITFTASPAPIVAGQCTNLTWATTNARELYINDVPQAGSGTKQECPTVTTTYTLRLVRLDGTTDQRQITVEVFGATGGTGGTGAFAVTFTSTATSITAGQCVTLNWTTSGVKEVYYQSVGVPGTGSRQECPGASTTYVLRVVKMDNSVDQRQITVTVGGTGGGTGGASITFNSTATSITSGQCVTLSWSVSGVQAVYYQGVGVTGDGSRQECPVATSTYTLSVTKLDGSSEQRQITVVVS